MATEGSRSASMLLLLLNLFLYVVVMIIASWAINHGIDRSHESASVLDIPARIFPIYFPVGNMATGFFVILSLLVSVLGITTSLTGIYGVLQGKPANLYASAASSLTTWTLTLLAMGFASKEIELGYTDSNLRTMEVLMIILSGMQLFCTGAIHVGAANSTRYLLP